MQYKKHFLLLVTAAMLAAVSVSAAPGDPYVWPAYIPSIDHDLTANNPYKDLPKPTQNLKPTGSTYNIVKETNSDWWTFYEGPLRKSNVTDQSIKNMLERFDHDFTYMTQVLGWPPIKRIRDGYRAAIYYHGSGVRTNNQFGGSDTTAEGGWQSSDGLGPIVLLSYVPIAAFHSTPGIYTPTWQSPDFQRDAAVHEGIHAVFSDLVNPNGQTTGNLLPSWFHEAGNTWAQKIMVARQTEKFGAWQDLDGTHFMAPFMPIECYSGWLQDGSFGGPSAEGVNMHINSSGQVVAGSGTTQACTWRSFLGGTQYGNGFTSFMGEWLGEGSVAWVCMNITSSNDKILGTMAKGLGEAQLRRFITEFRAKQATVDIRRWTTGLRDRMNSDMGRIVRPEFRSGNTTNGNNWCDRAADITGSCASLEWNATPYVVTTNDGSGVLTPEARTLPAWSGANQIPLKIPAGMSTIEIDFMPDTANMSLTIAYRDVNGYAVYSEPVYPIAGETGVARLNIPAGARPAGDVVIAVISNSDYIYSGDNSRRAKYKYKIGIKDGVTTAAITGANARYWNLNNLKVMPGHTGNTSVRGSDGGRPSVTTPSARPNISVRGRTLSVSSPSSNNFGGMTIRMIDVRGKVVAKFVGATVPGRPQSFSLTTIPAGRYFVEVRGAGVRQTLPVVVK